MEFYVIPRRVAWFDTVPGRVEALATMSLMQMIADAFENAYDVCNDDAKSSPNSSSWNEAQEAVRAWLVNAQFLPPSPRKRLPSPLPMHTEASSSTVLNPPNTPSRKWRISVGLWKLRRKRTHSGSTNSTSPLRSLLPLSPSKLWRRKRGSTVSFTTASESSTLSTLPSTPPTSSSRSLPVRSYTTPTYKKRLRFPTKFSYRQGSVFDDVQVSPLPETPARTPLPNALESVFHPLDNIPTRRSRILSFDGTTARPWSTPSFSSPSLSSSTSSFKWSTAKTSVLDKDLPEDRPPDVTLWTLVVITLLGYLFFFFLFVGCFLIAIPKLFRIFWVRLMSPHRLSD